MQFLFRKPSMPRPDQVLPGRSEAIVPPRPHFVNGRSITPPYPDGLRGRRLRAWAASGAPRRTFWSDPRRVGHGRRLPGRHDAQPDLPGVVHRQDRPRRGRAGRVRPEGRLVRAAAADVLGGPRPDAGLPPGQRRRHQYRSAIFTHSPAQLATATASRDMYAAELTKAGYGDDHDRDPRGAGVLLRRGLPPAVPREEPERLLPEPPDGRGAPRPRGDAAPVRQVTEAAPSAIPEETRPPPRRVSLSTRVPTCPHRIPATPVAR